MQNSTSDSRPGADRSPPNQPPDLSESDFLAAEANAARQKITDNLQRLRVDLKDCADVTAWARKYPWPTLGVAAALGFLAATSIGGRRSKDNVTELLAEALAAKGARANSHPKPSIFAGLFGELLRGLMGALEGVIAGAVSSRMEPRSPPDTNGHQEPPETP